MNKDLATAIGTAVAGVIISYLICNIFVGMMSTEDYSFKTVEETVSADVAEPNEEVFNYRSLNPTVEVYIGNCDSQSGDCDTENVEEISEDIVNEDYSSGSGQSSNNESEENRSSDAVNQRNQ